MATRKVGGYTGRILFVDLSERSTKIELIDPSLYRLFGGGYGTNSRIAYDFIEPGVDSMSPENPIIIGVGPIIGTGTVFSSKWTALTKWPVNGAVANACAGGRFGINLKKAGYDHLVIKGKSEKPVYLKVADNSVEICEANDLWGKDIYQTTDEIWKRYGKGFSVLSIGPAGENLAIETLALVDKVSTLGKGGLGALFGFKNLKAIIVNGTSELYVYDPERLKKINKLIIKEIAGSDLQKRLIEWGTMGGWPMLAKASSYKNWSAKCPHEALEELYSLEEYLKYKKKRMGDPNCPLPCKDCVKLPDGEFEGKETYASSLEGRIWNFATRCQVGGFEKAIYATGFCNRMGIDIRAITAHIDWAVDIFKRGVITKEDTGGIELDWNFETTMKLLDQVAENNGFGGILGGGILRAINKLGKETEEYSIHVKGMEPLVDPRLISLTPDAFFQVINPRGAHPTRSIVVPIIKKPPSFYRSWFENIGVSESVLNKIFVGGDPPEEFNLGRIVVYRENYRALMDSIGLGCVFPHAHSFLNIDRCVDIFNAVTGMDIGPQELLMIGNRSYNIQKVLNVREGFSRKDDRFPEQWYTPIYENGKKYVMTNCYNENELSREGCQELLTDYYDERTWNIERGVPTKESLLGLGLNSIANDLAQENLID